MSLKLKTLSLGLLALLAAGAMALLMLNAKTATTASAETGGHFVTDDTSGHTILVGEDKPGNTGIFIDPHNGKAEIFCEEDVKYHGTITTQTVTEITFTPTFPTKKESCFAKIPLGEFEAHIDANGCDFSFTIGKTRDQHNTTHLKCPTGKHLQVTVTGPFGTCTITIKPQTPTGGSGYYNIPENEITIKPTLTGIHAQYIGGPFKCGVSEGTTTTKGEFENRLFVKAFTTTGVQKSIAATGPED
jgi:hypothetical protein